MSFLGPWLDNTRKQHTKFWTTIFFLFLAALAGINYFVRPHEAEYHLDKYMGFWPLFGLVVALLMIIVMKKIIFPLITGPEDTYDSK